MKQLLALLLFVPSLCLAQSVTLPYNPDVNADSAITSTDLLGLLPIFGGFFTPEEVLIDGMTINEYLLLVEENGGALPVEGSEHGQMLYWNGEEWVLVSVGENGQFLGLIDNTPVWQDLPTGAGVPEVGCADQTACNYDAGASVNWAPLCVYEDECGVCDGPGAIYECGCADLPEGDCDCDGNQLDALNVCGGTCAADVDGDGICDDGDDCIGEADECGVCNGPGAIYECGCSEPDPEACDCAGNTLDAVGVCGGGCTEDADGDGICDTEDDCVGEYDFCGVCNGPGPILGCGCEDIPDGYCDCNGNVLDAVGTCGGACQNDFNGDGICDDDSIPGCTYEVACNYDPSASIYDGSCDFTSCYGCTDPAACNYSPAATFDNGNCWYPEASYDCDGNCLADADSDGICDSDEIAGCQDDTACNYDATATDDDGSCAYTDAGLDCDGNCLADADSDGICDGNEIPGCTDDTACNYNPDATDDDGSCATDGEVGCIDEEACNFNPDAICSDGDCQYLDECGECGGSGILGCNNPLADNYDEAASCDDGSCVVYGCTIDLACNYEPTANIDDNSCEFGNCPGCNNPTATNYNPTSTNDSACVITFSVSGTIEQFLIPLEWFGFHLEIAGGQGGNQGGHGAIISGDFFQTGTLTVLVGEEGNATSGTRAGGGGGSFVQLNDSLIMAAGGGGGYAGDYSEFIHASLSTSGHPGFTDWGQQISVGGENGHGATNVSGGPCAGNGGGYFTNGQPEYCCGGTEGFAFLNGGYGGPWPNPGACGDSGRGGFGGGGEGGHHGGGGGGGYSGGGASYHEPTCGGGGGSFNLGSNPTGIIGNLGNGYVQITRLYTPE